MANASSGEPEGASTYKNSESKNMLSPDGQHIHSGYTSPVTGSIRIIHIYTATAELQSRTGCARTNRALNHFQFIG